MAAVERNFSVVSVESIDYRVNRAYHPSDLDDAVGACLATWLSVLV